MDKPTLEFDVSSEVSLDQLSQEILPLLGDTQQSKMFINPRGPGGGNTQVLIYTTSERDMLAVLEYMKKHQLGDFA